MDRIRLRWPLLDRDYEMGRIAGLLDGQTTPESDGSRGLVLVGARGVGKSRLLRAAMDLAAGDGYAVAEVSAARVTRSFPLAAVAHLLGEFPIRRSADHLALHLRRAVARPGETDPADQRTLLVVDDGHLLDEESAAFVYHVVLHGTARVIVTVTAGVDRPDAVDALWKDVRLERLDLPPLSDLAVDQIIGHTFTDHVLATTRAWLRRVASGHPLYLRELIHTAVHSGVLRWESGAWRLCGPLPSNGRLADLVRGELDGLDAAVRSAVELVAVGEPLPLALIEHEPGFAAAERTGLLAHSTDGRRWVVRLAHPVFSEVIRARLPAGQARAIHRTLARRLAATPLRRGEDCLRLAQWRLAAGLPPDGALLVSAAHLAMNRLDFALAEQCARTAVDAGAPDAVPLLAGILHWRGRAPESAALLAAVAPTPRAIAAKARTLFWGLSAWEEARTVVAGAALSPETAAVRAMMALSDGDGQAAFQTAETVLEDATVSPESRVWAFAAAALAAAVLGRTRHARELCGIGIDLAARHHHQLLVGGSYLQITSAYVAFLAGQLSDARAAAAAGYDQTVHCGAAGLAAQWAGLLGLVAQVQGDLADAVSALNDATALAEQHDPIQLLAVYRTALAGTIAMTGDTQTAQRTLLQAQRSCGQIPALYRPHADASLAWVADARGDQHHAAATVIGGAANARERGLPVLEAFLLYEAVRHGAARRVRRRLAELADAVDSMLVQAYATAAAAWAAADGRLLERATVTFRDLNAPLLAAETAATAVRAYQKAGRSHDATAAAERHRAVGRHCRQTHTPALLVGPPAMLTNRERQIALLATHGMSNAQIADQLNVSPRTVSNHLAHAYSKLGIASRNDLGDALHPPRAEDTGGIR